MRVVFDSYTEIKSISTSDLPKSLFEVPEGYKKGKSWRDKLKGKK
jgi:hypothetical protein